MNTELLKKVNLDWSVRTENIKTESGVEIPDYKVIVRNDNNKPLSIRSKDYGVFQNSELMELLEKVSEKSGMEIHTGGSFDNGAKVWIQIKSNDLKIGNDKIKGYLTGINSFDGTTSLAFGPSNVTMSCTNKFFSTFRNMETKIRHTKNMMIRIDELMNEIDSTLEEEKLIFQNITRLSETRIGKNDVENVLRALFSIDKGVDLKDEESISTVTQNRLSKFHVDLDGQLKEKGNNLWGLFSGVTKYTTHSIGRGDNDKQKMFGLYGNRERKIFNDLVALV
jgi:phage/plasmid-like protein (TIGR03299 family)